MEVSVEVNSSLFCPSAPQKEIKKDVAKNSPVKVFICDNLSSHGVEFENLILVLDPNDSFMHQYVVEALMRCVNNLYICIIRKKQSGSGRPVVKDILKEWIKKELVNECAIEVCTKTNTHSLTEASSSHCKSGTTYHVHVNHERFDLCKNADWNMEIQDDSELDAELSRKVKAFTLRGKNLFYWGDEIAPGSRFPDPL